MVEWFDVCMAQGLMSESCNSFLPKPTNTIHNRNIMKITYGIQMKQEFR